MDIKKARTLPKALLLIYILLALLALAIPPVGFAAEKQITTDPSVQNYPVVSDGAVAWQDYRNPFNDPDTNNNIDIWTYLFPSGPETNITGNVSQEHPAIYGNKVVYHSFYPTKGAYNFEIFVDDISDPAPAKQLTFGNYSQVYPDIYENKIVYQDNRNPLSGYDIYLYDLSNSQEKRLTDNPSNQLNPEINGNKVVWQDLRNGGGDIYLKEFDSSSPSIPSSLVATAMSPSRIEVSWIPSSDNEGVAGYKVERSTDGTNFQELGNANGPPYADTGLPSSTTYWYRVRAYDTVGNASDYSNVF